MVDEIIKSSPFTVGRGETQCRGCSGEKLFSALDLGELPIANELLLTPEGEIEKFPLHLRICTDCGLGQVADVVTPERIFRDYRYLSSMSSTFLKHASDFVTNQMESLSFLPNDWVLEIASNDGYLLRNFLPHGVKTIGIEPAENVAELSRSLGIETISEFFSSQLASGLVQKFGFPKLIVANNVMAHVPDLMDFLKGLDVLCGPDTKISIENPSLSNILVGMQFDTIYHEHYSYLSITALSPIFESHGLRVVDVEELSTHGGSIRIYVAKSESSWKVDESVARILLHEQEIDPRNEFVWRSLQEKTLRVKMNLLDELIRCKREGIRVAAYGAAAKGNTLLNYCGISSDLVDYVVDLNPHKQGNYLPGSRIPIVDTTKLDERAPDVLLVLPWNLAGEVKAQLSHLSARGMKLLRAVPNLEYF